MMKQLQCNLETKSDFAYLNLATDVMDFGYHDK